MVLAPGSFRNWRERHCILRPYHLAYYDAKMQVNYTQIYGSRCRSV